jgi:uroporphyrinogen-III synthase
VSAAPAILLTRPRRESEKLAAALEAEGWAPLLWPLFDVSPTGAAPDCAGAQAVLLTSANAARALDAPPRLPAFCVGDATARAAEAAGYPQVESAGGDAAALARLVAARLRPADGPLLFLRGETVAGDLAGALRAGGFALRETVVYAMRETGAPDAPVLSALRDGGLAAAVFYSPRAAERFAARAATLGAKLASTVAVAISAAAAAPLECCGFARIVVAGRPDGAAMRAAVAALRPETEAP